MTEIGSQPSFRNTFETLKANIQTIPERVNFGLEFARQFIQEPTLWKQTHENRARQEVLKTIFIDQAEPLPVATRIIDQKTVKSRGKIDDLLGENSSLCFGDPGIDGTVILRENKSWTAAHYTQGELMTLAVVDLDDQRSIHTRVVINKSHEGRIESSQEPKMGLSRTTVHAFNHLCQSIDIQAQSDEVPPEILTQIKTESVTPEKLLLGQELFDVLNLYFGEPLKQGGVIVINDVGLGSKIAHPFTNDGRKQGWHPLYSEVDDTMLIWICRGNVELAAQVKALGQTSRGPTGTESARYAASNGTLNNLPLYPGYHPYLQSTENEPISPTCYSMLELAKAHENGYPAAIIDGAPATDRVYGTVIKLAGELGIKLHSVPLTLMVGAEVQGDHVVICPPEINYNLSLGGDCLRGFDLAMSYFNDVTLFSMDVAAGVGIPIQDFKDFYDALTANKASTDDITSAQIMLNRAQDFVTKIPLMEANARRIMGKSLQIPKDCFAAQDTIMGAYQTHPEWFETQELPLQFTSQSGQLEIKDKVKVVVKMTEEGKVKFRPWMWNAIYKNFGIDPPIFETPEINHREFRNLPLIGRYFRAFDSEIGKFGLQTTLARLSEKFGMKNEIVVPNETARKLEREACLIIANHPDLKSILPLLAALPNRDDVYLVAMAGWKGIGPHFSKHLIPIYSTESMSSQSPNPLMRINRSLNIDPSYPDSVAMRKNGLSIKETIQRLSEGAVVVFMPEGAHPGTWSKGISYILKQLSNNDTAVNYIQAHSGRKVVFSSPSSIAQIVSSTLPSANLTDSLKSAYDEWVNELKD